MFGLFITLGNRYHIFSMFRETVQQIDDTSFVILSSFFANTKPNLFDITKSSICLECSYANTMSVLCDEVSQYSIVKHRQADSDAIKFDYYLLGYMHDRRQKKKFSGSFDDGSFFAKN